jgi:hypothetical protein
MKLKAREIRTFLIGFACGGIFMSAMFLSPERLMDRFFERQVESKAIAAWERQAVGAGYDDCREKPSLCLGKIVEWPVTRRPDGTSCWGTNVSQVIRWRNPEQVPNNAGPSYPFTAVARVAGFNPDAVVLVYIGTPSAPFAGTTWKEKFGLSSSIMKGGAR